ncbi:MAG: homocysteine S-methyltransferase family protein [Clostridiales bacterium]|nr:homocysteine S-methyltransferase family protein [Clostridiales bacterium]
MHFSDDFLFFDGAMGTMLQKHGLKTDELPENYNITRPDVVLSIHKSYVAAGADVITTNTFGANSLKYKDRSELEKVITAGVSLAKSSGAKYVALDVGPTGLLLEPIGELGFEDAVNIFKEEIAIGVKAGADLIVIETMMDLKEAKAAVLAAKETCDLPVFATMTYQENGKTFLGADPVAATITLCSLGVDAVGLNCSIGPKEVLPTVRKILEYASVPVIVQANAGLPTVDGDSVIYNIDEKEYAESVIEMAEMGVSVIGGCCGTTPDYIAEIRRVLSGKKPIKRSVRRVTAVTSAQRAVILDGGTAIIGERINPTGKKKIKEALRTENYDCILNEAINQQEHGADLLDVNAGLPEINETETLKYLVKELQAVTPLPLQIDSSSPEAVEAAVRCYNGKPIINSVNGTDESIEKILPIAKKYGAAVIALTLDENGIPNTADERLHIAEKILDAALDAGIKKEDVLVDCLVMTASASQSMVMETLRALTLVKQRLGLKTVLGVSNVSFGLPSRELINSTFLAAAFGAGLDMPILNPMSKAYTDVVAAFKVLNNEDKNAESFIANYSVSTTGSAPAKPDSIELPEIILKGKKGEAAEAVKALLPRTSPMEIINDLIIPALNEVGKRFESGKYFLPQLTASAEAAKAAFDAISLGSEGEIKRSGEKIILATVKGDIHDIGKNIVGMLLKNYGYEIIDLGKNVEPETIIDTLNKHGDIKLIGLSALMTTTVRNMADTVTAVREAGIDCKIMVGGAVLNEEYSKLVGADYYAKDAAEAARIAAEVFGK